MKKLLLLLLFIGGLAYAQDNDYEQINLKFGVNLINGSASGNPFDFGEGPAFSNPYYFELEYRFNKSFSLGLVGTLNEWQPGDELNKTILSEKRDYFAADLDGKFYFKDAFNILQDWKWLDLYIHGGVGYFTADEGSLSLNIGPGLNIWFSEDVGLSLGGTSKWAIDDHPDFDTNYYQFTAGIAFRLRDKDFDNDGVSDFEDNCPKIYGPQDNNGCPEPVEPDPVEEASKDSDGDGILDKDDQCPKVVGPSNNNGCPLPDSDGDGVLDKSDKCPYVVGSFSNDGCPVVDSDGDGILDTEDDCPNSAGTALNNGCPKEPLVLEIPDVLFRVDSYKFTTEARSTLALIVDVIKQYPEEEFIIKGYTDNLGDEAYNQSLSEKRANSVKAYLVKKGISAEQLTTKGYGQSNPLHNNQTREGRRLNRRVEIEVKN